MSPRPIPKGVKFAPISGYLKRGPDYDEGRQGWWVYANASEGVDVPVTLLAGHRDKGASPAE